MDRIDYIDTKLYKLTKAVDIKLNEFDVREQKRKVLPKARLMVWDGDVMQYQSFKRQMMELLDYDNPSLELETLKQQIKGPKASEALKCHNLVNSGLYYKETLKFQQFVFSNFLILVLSGPNRPLFKYFLSLKK